MSELADRVDSALAAEQSGDLSAAVLLFYRAAIAGNSYAKLRLGRLLLENRYLGAVLESATNDLDAGDALYWLQWASREGMAEASLLAGDWLISNSMSDEGYVYHVTAAEQGHPGGLARIQDLFQDERSNVADLCSTCHPSALEALLMGVVYGDAWALAQSSWLALVLNETDEGIRLLGYEQGDTYPGLRGDSLARCEEVLAALQVADPDASFTRAFAGDVADAHCYAALLRLAAGRPMANSIAAWEELREQGHPASILFLAVAAARGGKVSGVETLVPSLSSQEVADLRHRFTLSNPRASAWLATWAKDCAEALSPATPPRSG